MLEQYLKDLSELVNFDCGTANCAGVTHAAQIMKRHFESIGFSAELVDLGEKAGNGLFATNRPGADHYDVLLNAHLDTVFADGTAAKRPFSIVDDHVMGPGCCDCKSGVLGIFYAIKNAPKEVLDKLSIAVCYNPDEETGSLNSKDWIGSVAAKASCALVCEGARPNGQLVRARKGTANYVVRFHGRASHAGNNPKDGRSAVLAACRFTLEAGKLADLDGKGTSLNVGVFKGGTASNVVPEFCELRIDVRYWRAEDQVEVQKGLEAMVAQSWGEDITCELEALAVSPSMPYTDATKELVGRIEAAARRVGFEASFVDAGGGSDANHIAKAGVPVVDGVGPAGGCFHTPNEYLIINTIEERVNMVTEFLKITAGM